ncbi:MAG: prepilin-type N-terminal cleavage/methylation domain-containing protein [Candidatus Paceibacterota bacterium]
MYWRQKGFTLIELLVVISIIGVLSTIAMTSLNGARTKARDVKRISEIEQIQKALELYYADNGQYPVSGGATSPNGGWSNSNDASWDSLQTKLAPYMTALPKDPVNTSTGWAGWSNTYTYTYYSLSYGCEYQWYMLVYRLESRGVISPGIKACNGTVFNYSGTITVGDCKGC